MHPSIHSMSLHSVNQTNLHIQSLNVKAFELRSNSKAQLTEKLAELKSELANLRVQKVASGSANKVSQM